MADADELLRAAAGHLRSLGAQWALVGALAVGVRSEPRFTRDVDFAVAVDTDAEAEALVFSLSGSGYRVVASTEHETSGRIAAVRLLPSDADAPTVVVDLLFASSGIENEIVGEAEELEVLPTFVARVALTGHLIALKLLSEGANRPYDLGDLRGLLAVASDADLESARRAVGLIQERGYNRGRDLVASLDKAIALRR